MKHITRIGVPASKTREHFGLCGKVKTSVSFRVSEPPDPKTTRPGYFFQKTTRPKIKPPDPVLKSGFSKKMGASRPFKHVF